MPYDFFLSYTRANNDVYLLKFFNDLSEEVRTLRGYAVGTAVGFFDQREIELGEEWDPTIVAALNSSKVLLSIASPAYFKSDYCGKEVALFSQRLPAVRPAQGHAPVIKSLVWAPFKTADVPPPLRARQFTIGDVHALHNTKGFRHLIKQLADYQTTYNDLVFQLAQDIVQTADAHQMPPLAAPSSLGGVASLWGGDWEAQNPGAVDPNRVHFIYVAAHPQRFGNARAQDPYLDIGGADWKPFFPDRTRIHRFMQKVLSADDLDFTSDEVAFGPDLLQRIQRASENYHIVVLVIDAWSLYWDSVNGAGQMYQQLLTQLDRRNDYHWCVMIPWNEQDRELMDNRVSIEPIVQATFDFHGRVARNPMFFRDGIKNFEELRQALIEVVTRLKDEIRKSVEIIKPVPAGPSKAVISGGVQ